MEEELQVRVHRGRLEPAPACATTAIHRGHRSEQHHPAQVEPRGIGYDIVAQFLGQEINRSSESEFASTGQREPRVHLHGIDGTVRMHRPMRQPLQQQRRRKPRQLGQRDRPGIDVEVHRLPADRMDARAPHSMRDVATVLVHDVQVRRHELLRSGSVQRCGTAQRAANGQGGEQQLHDIDLQRRQPHVQVARAHHHRLGGREPHDADCCHPIGTP